MARGHDMNRCTPPSLRTVLDSGPQIEVVGVAEQNLHARVLRACPAETPFTVATVPTGMKTGVSTSPCGVSRRPARAVPERHSI